MDLTVYFLLLSLSLTSSVFGANQVKAYIKSLKCIHDATVCNGTIVCRIKPTRDRDAITTAYFNFTEPVNDLWYHLKLFYKFGTIYRPFMVDVDIDVCELFRKPYVLPKLVQMLKDTMNKEVPNFVHPCPYYGQTGFQSVNVNKVLGKLIPQVIPKGLYKAINRWHTNPKDNRTMITGIVEIFIDAVDPLKSYEIG